MVVAAAAVLVPVPLAPSKKKVSKSAVTPCISASTIADTNFDELFAVVVVVMDEEDNWREVNDDDDEEDKGTVVPEKRLEG